MSSSPAYGYAPWIAEMTVRAAAIDTTLSRPLVTDLYNQNDVEIYSSGTGSATFDVAMAAGWANLQTGTTGNSSAGIYNAGGANMVSSATGEPWFVHARIKVISALDASAEFHLVGMQSKTTGALVTLGIAGPPAASFPCIFIQDGGGSTLVTSTMAVDFTAEHDYDLTMDFVNATLIGFVDGAEAVRTTDFTHLTSDPTYFYSFLTNGGVAANRQMYTDRLGAMVQ